ncbi:MAG: hypothetical protein GEV13_18690 [Rhodospirillales bacterium]|nr:hypothetical protein [Rhodospirillales bacterium]
MKVKADLVSLFQVPLQCLAAPEIACGSRARPILLALESDPGISEAWVNRAGSMLAVVGSKSSSRDSRAKTVVALFEEFEKNVATETVGKARETAATSFLSGDGWYRSAQTVSLSMEEADIIAARLVRRIQSEVPLTDETTKALESGFAEVFKRQFTGETGQPKPVSQEPARANVQQRNDQLVKVARENLDEAGMTAFQEALAKGHRPQPGEK